MPKRFGEHLGFFNILPVTKYQKTERGLSKAKLGN